LIDGLTAEFDKNCGSSLTAMIGSSFRIKDYKNIADPRNTMKFQISANELT
jgi:uncharacterized SAM-dependent methyltransferase